MIYVLPDQSCPFGTHEFANSANNGALGRCTGERADTRPRTQVLHGWQAKPAIVRKATTEYLAAEDTIGRWLEDRCITNDALWTAGATLLSDYQAWAARTGERPMSQKHLTQALEGRGLVQTRTRTARGFAGIGLRVDVTHVTDSPVIPVTHARRRPI